MEQIKITCPKCGYAVAGQSEALIMCKDCSTVYYAKMVYNYTVYAPVAEKDTPNLQKRMSAAQCRDGGKEGVDSSVTGNPQETDTPLKPARGKKEPLRAKEIEQIKAYLKSFGLPQRTLASAAKTAEQEISRALKGQPIAQPVREGIRAWLTEITPKTQPEEPTSRYSN